MAEWRNRLRLFWRNGSTATYRIYLIDSRYTDTEDDDDDDVDVTLIIYLTTPKSRSKNFQFYSVD